MKIAFREKNFSGEARSIVRLAVSIMDDYEGQGYKLSLRQLYYQLVARNAVPNTEASYKRVGDIIADARMAGLLDWDMIEDRNRSCITPSRWDHPGQIVETCARSYRIDKWATQPHFCEVMVEKQALEGVLEPVCNELDIPFTSNKGYSSMTMLFQAGRKLRLEFLTRCAALHKDRIQPFDRDADLPDANDRRGFLEMMQWLAGEEFLDDLGTETEPLIQLSRLGIGAGLPRIVVFYLGDHDPSGIDMTRDVAARLCTFSDMTPIEVRRLALNMDQIEELQPPENPAKITDSRARKYIERFGESSWELDAVAPDQLAEIVRTAVVELRNENLWADTIAREAKERQTLKEISDKLNRKTKRKK